MATRSTIAIELQDGTVRQVYCHWDGYLENNGQLLQKYWSDPDKLIQLIDLGNLSSLSKEIGVKHEFQNPYKFGTQEYKDYCNQFGHMCLFYGRDRGEEDCEARAYESFEQYRQNANFEEYNYVFRKDGCWYVEFYGEFDGKLSDAFEYEQAERAE